MNKGFTLGSWRSIPCTIRWMRCRVRSKQATWHQRAGLFPCPCSVCVGMSGFARGCFCSSRIKTQMVVLRGAASCLPCMYSRSFSFFFFFFRFLLTFSLTSQTFPASLAMAGHCAKMGLSGFPAFWKRFLRPREMVESRIGFWKDSSQRRSSKT